MLVQPRYFRITDQHLRRTKRGGELLARPAPCYPNHMLRKHFPQSLRPRTRGRIHPTSATSRCAFRESDLRFQLLFPMSLYKKTQTRCTLRPRPMPEERSAGIGVPFVLPPTVHTNQECTQLTDTALPVRRALNTGINNLSKINYEFIAQSTFVRRRFDVQEYVEPIRSNRALCLVKCYLPATYSPMQVDLDYVFLPCVRPRLDP